VFVVSCPCGTPLLAAVADIMMQPTCDGARVRGSVACRSQAAVVTRPLVPVAIGASLRLGGDV
jgi:hypothetical protein